MQRRRRRNAGIAELRQHRAPGRLEADEHRRVCPRPPRQRANDHTGGDQPSRPRPVAQRAQQHVGGEHSVDRGEIVGVLPAEQERDEAGRSRPAQASRLFAAQHELEDEGVQRRGDEVRLREDAIERVALGDEDVERKVELAARDRVFQRDQDPAESGTECRDEKRRAPLQPIGEEQRAETVDDDQKQHRRDDPQDLQAAGRPETKRAADRRHAPPEQVEEQRPIGLRRQRVDIRYASTGRFSRRSTACGRAR